MPPAEPSLAMDASEPPDAARPDRWYERATRRVRPLDRAEERELVAVLDAHRAAVARHVLGSPIGLAYLQDLRIRLEARTLDVREVVEAEADEQVESMRRACLGRLGRVAKLAATRQQAALERELRGLRLQRGHVDAVVARMEIADPRPTEALDAFRFAEAAARRARTRLVESHLRLVLAMARRRLGRGLDLPDLVQEGTLGLMRAVDRFEQSHGVSFGTYATWWVRQRIGRALSSRARPIRLPMSVEDQLQKVRVHRRRLVIRRGHTPTVAELAVDTRLPAARIADLLRIEQELCHPHIPFDDALAEDGQSPSEVLADERPGPEAAAVARRLRDHARSALRTLSPRERQVLRLRYGIGRGVEHTLEEIGNEFGLTRQRILQITTKALKKLRASRHAERLRAFYEA